jgi:hypothetical protein
MNHRNLLFAIAALGATSIAFSQSPSPPSSAATVPDSQTIKKPPTGTTSQSGAPSRQARSSAQTAEQSGAKHAHQEQVTQEARPDAVYAKPSGQDSQPRPSNVVTHRTVDTGQPSNQPSVPPPAGAQKTYRGNTGKKSDPGTACNTARVKPNGDLDCGTGGQAALSGKIPR